MNHTKEKKKHTLRNIILVGIMLVVAIIWFLPDDDTGAGYNAVDEETELTQLVDELSAGGEPLIDTYNGTNGLWGVEQEQQNLRSYYTDTANAQSVTMMVYVIGSDLESECGAASSDLQEMIDAQNGAGLNVVVQTGGAAAWQNEIISADVRQRWLIQDGGIALCDTLPQASMSTPESLGEFISWSAENFPADRYMLVLWDHGGGTVSGYGYDENFPDGDMLTLPALAQAVQGSGVKFDIIGFDACLMGTLETAYALEPYADYLLASEETENQDGWYYTETLSALSENPAMPSVELGARLIDSFAEFYEENDGTTDVTLSLLGLREVPALYEACTAYYDSSAQVVQQDGFQQLSTARSNSRAYGDNGYEQIDLVDYVQRTSVENADAVIRAAFSAVKYRNASTLEGSYGTAVYFPYLSPEYYQDIMAQLEQISYTGAESFYNVFLSTMVGGGEKNRSAVNPMTGYQQEETDWTQTEWYDADAAQNYDYTTIADSEELVVDFSDKEDAYLLSLPDEQWDSITDIQLQVMLDDGEGYIDLGSDQTYDWTDDGQLILDFDNTWVSIDGNLAAYHALEPIEHDNETLFTGTTPALLNGETSIDLYLQWKQDADGNSEASVLGYIPTEENTTARPKGYFTLQAGDQIELLCDYYTYDGEYDSTYVLSDPITITSQDALTVGDYDLDTATSICWFQLTDIFQQYWYTETIEISYEE